ncbi:phytanoyl-CoA dioxygenase family protein [Nocardia sp. CNY236]|uniref:phytanoyl-CoA dioxygenase family protein n=1 Tax=Nocardia sp. CNY236 TaxID=1169152 RepID=UPI000403DA30|nr:phytanoyl-CoA dioxygenase family protein [Nocardia sp. CNY236]
MSETIQTLDAADPIDAIIGQLRENGAVVIEDFLDDDLLNRFNAEIGDVLDTVPEGRELSNPLHMAFFGAQTRHLSGVAGYSRIFATEVLCHPLYKAIADDILLPFCSNYRLNVAHVLDRGPGSEQQFPHRDEDVWIHLPRPHPEIQLASVIALNDFTAQNGATRVVPGSHRWDPQRIASPDELVPAEMRAGSAVVYLGSTIHGGGPNTTEDTRRRGMHLSFNVGWLRTEENNYLVNPIETVRDLPERAQELLGYRVHDASAHGGGAVGLYRSNDPLEMIRAGQL